MRRLLPSLCLLAALAACTDVPMEAATPSATPSVATMSPAPTPSPTPAPRPTLPPGPDRSALVGRLDEAAALIHEDATVSIAVLDAEGRLVYSLDGDQPILPASTAKLLPGAAALTLFGPDHRFETRVDSLGEVDDDGVLRGRLEVVADGEPALTTLDYRSYVYIGRPHAPLEELADQVAASGIKVVTGGVVAAPDLFGSTPEAPGWKPDYLQELDARRITSLTVNGGLDLTVTSPPPDLQLELVGAEDPTEIAMTRFRQLLRDRGLVLWPEATPPLATRRTVATLSGPPLLEHLTFAFERSDNHTADMLMRRVGLEGGETDWVGSGEVVAQVLVGVGVDITGLKLRDGAGLSREDEVSAIHLAATDQAMRAGPQGDAWRDALAEAGSEGTLRRRLLGTVAQGRFLGKTGTLDDVTAVAGTVEGPDGEAAYHFAGMINLPPGVGRFLDRLVMDDMIALLAEDAAGCTRAAPPTELPTEEPVVGGLYVTCDAADTP